MEGINDMFIQALDSAEFINAAIDFVSGAEKSIFISTFKAEISSKVKGEKLMQFFQILAAKKAEGVDVRMLFDTPESGKHIPPSNAKALKFLQKNNIKCKSLRNGRLCHAKMLIVDNANSIVGSHNLSVMSCRYNFELSVSIPDNKYCQNLTEIFERVWEKGIYTTYKNK